MYNSSSCCTPAQVCLFFNLVTELSPVCPRGTIKPLRRCSEDRTFSTSFMSLNQREETESRENTTPSARSIGQTSTVQQTHQQHNRRSEACAPNLHVEHVHEDGHELCRAGEVSPDLVHFIKPTFQHERSFTLKFLY